MADAKYPGSGPSPLSEQTSGSEERTRKRDFFRFGKKDEKKPRASGPAVDQPTLSGGLRPVSPLASPGSPGRSHPYGISSSPRGMRSASPRTHSPASSMIFERSVQEDVGAVPQASPQIPSHVITENHIPPALDATAEAITDRKLDPDSVEIVTHSAHQPAAVTITEAHHDQPTSPILSDDNLRHTTSGTESLMEVPSASASNYANLDSVDVRRLSFISFADVVHAEHDIATGDNRRDSAAIMSHPSFNIPRSPSPLRSPLSSTGATGTSPPTSHETSPHRPAAGPVGDLNIETMRQALRKTGSGDLSGFRSPSVSATGNEDGLQEKPSFR